MDGNARIVTFGNGQVAREVILSIDDDLRRVAWAIVDPPFEHYNGAACVEPEVGGTRFIWTVDLLPDTLAERVEAMMSAGVQVIQKTLGRAGHAKPHPGGVSSNR